MRGDLSFPRVLLLACFCSRALARRPLSAEQAGIDDDRRNRRPCPRVGLGMSHPEQPEQRPKNGFTIRPARAEELPLVTAIDDDASYLFATAGLSMAHLRADHPFVLREHARWAAALERRCLFVACQSDETPRGFASLGTVDGEGHLGQLSVLRAAMRQGIGRALVSHARGWAKGRGALWLTTYAHVPWNRPYYESMGFSVVPERLCGPDIREILDEERAVLPAPEHRVAMRLGT